MRIWVELSTKTILQLNKTFRACREKSKLGAKNARLSVNVRFALVFLMYFFVPQNQQLVKNSEESSQLMNLEDTMSNLRQQVEPIFFFLKINLFFSDQ